MAGRRIVYLASLIGCLVFYYFYREWLSWLFLMALVALPWLPLLLTLPVLLTVRAELEVAGAVTVALSLPHPCLPVQMPGYQRHHRGEENPQARSAPPHCRLRPLECGVSAGGCV